MIKRAFPIVSNNFKTALITRMTASSAMSSVGTRFYSVATETVKPNVALIAKIRKETQCSLSKAREALVAAKNSYEDALAWLDKDASISGAKKAAKLDGRVAKQGVVAVMDDGMANMMQGKSLLYGRSVMIELNCETDFVAKSDVFVDLSKKIVWTCYMLADNLSGQASAAGVVSLPVEACLAAPVMPLMDVSQEALMADAGKTIQELILETVGKLGENIQLRRVVAVLPPVRSHCASTQDCKPIDVKDRQVNTGGCGQCSTTSVDKSMIVSGLYVHGATGTPKGMGRIGAIVSLKVQSLEEKGAMTMELLKSQIQENGLATKARQLAQHVVGMKPLSLEAKTNDCESDQVLVEQSFLFGGGSVREVVSSWSTNNISVSVVDFQRFECGEE